MAIQTTPIATLSFPREVEITITLRLKIRDQEELDAWVDPTTNTPSLDAKVDLLSIIEDATNAEILAVNGATKEQLQLALSIAADHY